ncbi:MAG: MATE family efflux transporter, partial [Candidatus Sulfotelmatobacter sp.]
GGAWLFVALVALVSTPVRNVALPANRETAELLRYGLQRLPGDFILIGLLSVPVIFVAHRSGIEQAGFVAFAISVLSMIGAFFSPFGLILLPKASSLLAAGKKDVLRVHVNRLVQVAIAVSALATVLIFVFARYFIKVYLGVGFEQAVGTMQWVVLGAVPYALFTILRNLIDAFHRNAVTAVITTGSFALFALGAWLPVGHLAASRQVLLALLLGLTALGGAAWVECNRILRHEPE